MRNSCVLLNVFEKIVYKPIHTHIGHLSSTSQHRFMQGSATTNLVHFIQTAMNPIIQNTRRSQVNV